MYQSSIIIDTDTIKQYPASKISCWAVQLRWNSPSLSFKSIQLCFSWNQTVSVVIPGPGVTMATAPGSVTLSAVPSPILYRLDMTIIQRNRILWDYITETETEWQTHSYRSWALTLTLRITQRRFIKPLMTPADQTCVYSQLGKIKEKEEREEPESGKESGVRFNPNPAGWRQRCSNTLLMLW